MVLSSGTLDLLLLVQNIKIRGVKEVIANCMFSNKANGSNFFNSSNFFNF